MLPIQARSLRRVRNQYSSFAGVRTTVVPSRQVTQPDKGAHDCEENSRGNFACQCNSPNGPWACCKEDPAHPGTSKCVPDLLGACRCTQP
jgi:hypothetical protein